MKQIEKKDSSEVSGGVSPLVVDDPNPGCITPPDFPQNPVIGDPFGESDLPVGSRG